MGELETQMGGKDFWNVPENARKVVGELKALKAVVVPHESLQKRIADAAVLHQLAVEEHSAEAMEEVAEVVGIQPAEVREIVTFYSMFREEPVGRYVLGVCGTLSCALCGGEGLLEYLQEKLGIEPGGTTDDGLLSLEVIMCLGACAWAPAMLVNDQLHVLLTRAKVDAILEKCRTDGAT
jgi:NADH-quinone oxidoreductase subunit E